MEHLQKYPINIHFLKDSAGKPYVFAYLPDFGYSVCSATGDNVVEALLTLALVQKEIVEYYQEQGESLPEPSGPPWGDTL